MSSPALGSVEIDGRLGFARLRPRDTRDDEIGIGKVGDGDGNVGGGVARRRRGDAHGLTAIDLIIVQGCDRNADDVGSAGDDGGGWHDQFAGKA